MYRRRRRTREIPFSFDSFLDIVANVVGIIIRLILVVWVGARSYGALQPLPVTPPTTTSSAEPALPPDPLSKELDVHRRELAAAQERLLAQLRLLQDAEGRQTQVRTDLAFLDQRERQLADERSGLTNSAAGFTLALRQKALTVAELHERSKKLADELRALEQSPPPKKALRYHTPVSRPLTSEELLFECSDNRITFIDIGALLGEVRQDLEDKGKELRTQWRTTGSAGPAGAFRMRYTLERERAVLDPVGADAAPASSGFRFGLSDWVLEPVSRPRGETADAALRAGSEFRQIADGIDPRQTAVTFWVYPDSFAIFRRLRDYLYERDVTVAGRPLPPGVPIASSRRGSVSRGQ